jgi:hypothetical protein
MGSRTIITVIVLLAIVFAGSFFFTNKNLRYTQN